MEVISFNLDELPDAGESVIRKYGADWQCLHLPEGKNSSIYKTYVRRNPLALRVSSTGQSAIIMAESVGSASRRMEPPIGIVLLARLLPDLGLVTITAHSFPRSVQATF